MKSKNKAIDICLEFSDEIFHNPDITNIIVRIKKDLVVELHDKLDGLNFGMKRVIRENAEYSLVNFEKIYPIDF
jgi:hypothetical protein